MRCNCKQKNCNSIPVD
jgi:hypothetical protein